MEAVTVSLEVNGEGRGTFWLIKDGERIREMQVLIQKTRLVVYHTEVQEPYTGRGFAKQLLETIVEYARNKGLKVSPLCPYVHSVFKRNPEQFQDLWHA